MEYIIPIVLFICLGLLAGVLLTVFSRVFAVEQDERAVKVREVLPGANCGACGFAGCDAYAEAVANGAKTNACIPGGDSVSRQISAIMGSAYEDVAEQVAVVHCSGTCGVTGKKYEYAGEMTCDAVSRLYGGNGACPSGCIGLGDCVKACPFGAISVKDGAAVVDRSLCTGCGLCAKACPKHLIGLFAAEQRVEVLCQSPLNGKATMAACKAGCIGCKKCERNCPSGAIHVQNNHAVIDHEKCTGCGACAEGCPTHCIHLL